MDTITEQLLALQDLEYKQFHSKLMPTIDSEVIIGVRTPELRKLTKELKGSSEAEAFLRKLPHQYYEENNLHGFLIETIKDFDACIAALNEFLPYVDNWATCDMLSPKELKKNLPGLYEWVKIWIASGNTYTVRFGVNMLMKYYLEEAFLPEYPELVASSQSEEYYIKMVVAWYFATALAKQYDLDTQVIYAEAPCPVVDYRSEPFRRLEAVAAEVYPGVGICPYVMTGGTDARHYREVSDHCLRFAPLYIDKQQYESIHGINENIYQGALPMGVDFYKKMIEKS